jgi:O-antigen/teichoic acid export membrane protein
VNKYIDIRRNIAANYIGRAYSIIAIYLFVPFYIKILGIESYGVIAFYSVLQTLTALADIGLSATFSREAARHLNREYLLTLLSTIERVLYFGVGMIALLLFSGSELIAARWLNASALDAQTVVWSLRLMALMLIPQLGMSLYSAGLTGLQRQVSTNLIQSLFVTVRSGLVVLPILWWPELPVFLGWQLAATLAFAVVTRASLVKAIGFQAFAISRSDYSTMKAHLMFAGGMLAISIISSINTQVDKLLVSRLFSLTEFGYYNLASSLAQVPVALATPIAVAFYPRLTVHVAKGEMVQERQAYETYGQWIALISALGSFGLALFAPELLTLWLRDPSLTQIVAKISASLVIGSLFLCLQMPSYYLALAHGHSRLIAALAMTTLMLCIPLTIVAVRALGLPGAPLPWITLNFMNFMLLTTIVERRYYARSYLGRLARTIGTVFAIALLPLIGARLVADALQSSPVFTCAIAAATALCILVAFAADWPAPIGYIKRNVMT